MAELLKSTALRAELASLEGLLRLLPEEDLAGRIGLESRRRSILTELERTIDANDTLASTALFFGGKPVIGSLGIQADFAANAIFNYQDLVAKIWATSLTEVANRGAIA